MALIKAAAWSDIALGAWLLAAPSVVGYQASRPVVVFEDLVPGLFLCFTSGLILAAKLRPLRVEWLQVLCGLWLMAGSVALVFSRLPHAALNAVFVGVAVCAVSLVVWASSDSGSTVSAQDR
jgi:ABC-type thiamin/hydroxymethylpyrimidine transport system permease subunit